MNNIDWKSYLFSFDGREPRSRWWLMIGLGVLVSIVAVALNGRTADGYPRTGLGSLLELAWLWPTVAVSMKRWHDHDKSGLWVLIYLVPVIGWLWVLIECGCLAGTTGPNRFGPDPLRSPAQT